MRRPSWLGGATTIHYRLSTGVLACGRPPTFKTVRVDNRDLVTCKSCLRESQPQQGNKP